ncbi:MAG: DUF4355 domain-containing protein [Clostridiales bacterium]|nr:DUF4355 domain-containing protein [Clostridiales bacterium]
MNETVNQENATNNQETTAEKTFTQAELDAIVSDRLKRERSKYEGFDELKAKADKFDALEEASKSELQKATERAQALEAELNGLKKTEEIRKLRESVANETGVPANLLSGEDEETLKTQALAIKAFASNGNAYPQVKDGGEVTTPMARSPRTEFMQFAASVNE